MSDVLIDTQILAWSLIAPERLSAAIRDILQNRTIVHVPPCCLHEITLKVRKGRWNAMGIHAERLDTLCATQGFRIAPYTGRMAMRAGSMEWDHVDPFDRMIAATALEMSCPLIANDAAFDGLAQVSGWKGRIWSEESIRK